jgi:hypothetical protein
MRQLYKYGTLGRVLKGEYAEIDQIKAKNEYDHAKPILEEYLNELVWMKYQATEAAQEVINDVISDVEYAMQYYKDLSFGKDVWRTQSSPRFRISEKGKQIQAEVDKFTEKYNSRPVYLLDLEMTNEELDAIIPTLTVEELKEAVKGGKKGFYSPYSDKIYIFVDNQSLDEIEESLFHENTHAIFHGSEIFDAFDKGSEGKLEVIRESVEASYPEKDWAEELFACVSAHAMEHGYFEWIDKYLPEEFKDEYYNKIGEFGYDKRQESRRRTSCA